MYRILLVCAAILSLMSCGPSSAQIKTARSSHYTCEPEQIVGIMAAELEERQPPLAGSDDVLRIAASEFRWHSSEGLRKKPGSAQVGPGDVAIRFELAVRESGSSFFIQPVVRVLTHEVGSPRGSEISRKHANWPPWVDPKMDTLMVAIHGRLKGCAVHQEQQ